MFICSSKIKSEYQGRDIYNEHYLNTEDSYIGKKNFNIKNRQNEMQSHRAHTPKRNMYSITLEAGKCN